MAVEEPVNPRSEGVENPSSRDDGELARLENHLAVIEEAMDRIEEGDLEVYDALVVQFDGPSGLAGVEEGV